MTVVKAAIRSMKPLPVAGPYPTDDPFLFCVYHKDAYPAGNDQMEAPRTGNGMDFNPSAPYRMYHGTNIPGFPQHPHRGFETITATLEGLVDHADSLGNAGRYGNGDLQWMTAGSGIVHSEMFPLLHQHQPNPLRFFQVWLNLPARHKMVPPSFAMFWHEGVPKVQTDDYCVTNWIGNLFGKQPNAPPEHSWAAEESNQVALVHICVQPGGSLELPTVDGVVNRSLFYIEGDSEVTQVNETQLKAKTNLSLDASQSVILSVHVDAPTSAEFLLLQGRPIAEPVAQKGPFVMNEYREIMEAYRDYAHTHFGGWPWPRDDMVFERTKPRFALFDGKESRPKEKKVSQKRVN